MYTSIRRYRVKDQEEVTRRVREGLIPKIKEIPGFVGYYVMQGEGGTWVSTSVFETREGVEESNRIALEFNRESRLEELFEGEPDILVGESKVEEMAHREHPERRAA